MILRDVEESSTTVQLYFIVENLGWNSITNPTRFRITTGRHRRNRNSRPHEWWESVVVISRWWRRGMRRYQVYTKCGSHAVHATYSGTEGKRDSPRFDSLFFACDVDETLVCINGINCSARHAFFAFVIVLTLTTSTSVLLYQVCMPSSRIACTRRHEVPCCTY